LLFWGDLESDEVEIVAEEFFVGWKEIIKRYSLVFCWIWFTMNLLFNYSLEETSVASNTIISSTSSIFTLVFSVIWLKNKISVYNVLGVVFA
jgi:solute carrier family 35 protein F5